MGEMVEVRVFRPNVDADEFAEMLERFDEAAHSVSQFEHPNITRIYDYGSYNQSPFLVLPLRTGVRLSEALLERDSFPVELTLRLSQQLCEAVAVAHAVGVLHANLSVDTIQVDTSVVGSEHILINEFGMGLALSGAKTNLTVMTKTGRTVGDPTYMSPELFGGRDADPRSDIYSLAVIIYHMLSGRPPFQSESLLDLLLYHRSEEPPAFADTAPELEIPKSLEEVLMKALKKDPDERYLSVRSFLEALRESVEFPEEVADEDDEVVRAEQGLKTFNRVSAPKTEIEVDSIEGATPNGLAPLKQPLVSEKKKKKNKRKRPPGRLTGAHLRSEFDDVDLEKGLEQFDQDSSKTSKEKSSGSFSIVRLLLLLTVGVIAAGIGVLLSVEGGKQTLETEKTESDTAVSANAESETPKVVPALTVEKPTEPKEETYSLGVVPIKELGIEARVLNPSDVARLGRDVFNGLVVVSVTSGGPASKVGLKKGDLIQEVETKGENITKWKPVKIESVSDLTTAIRQLKGKKKKMALVVKRANFERMLLFVTLD
jgi:serine/threonine-protein kinase